MEGEVAEILRDGFAELQQRPGWANARDAQGMFGALQKQRDVRRAAQPQGDTKVTQEDARKAVAKFLAQRPAAPSHDIYEEEDGDQLVRERGMEPPPKATHSRKSQHAQPREGEVEPEEVELKEWEVEEEINKDPKQQELRDLASLLALNEQEARERLQKLNAALFEQRRQEAERLEKEMREMAERIAEEEKRRAALELLRKLEEERRKAHEAWLESERVRKLQQQAKEAKEKEARRQAELQRIGQCCMGFPWINRGGGSYQCAGGSHWHTFSD